MSIKKLVLKAKLKLFPAFFTSKDMKKWLEINGVSVGAHTVFYRPSSMILDITRPELLEIGDYCKITANVTILAHDYSRSVLRRVYGEIINEARKTVIGDNVFIGMGAIILMGAHIGNNVIVGAGSVVSGNIPDNVVVAGNPAKVICTLEEHYNKRKEQTVKEAINYAKILFEKKGRYPTIHEMGAFFPLYLERSHEALLKHNLRTNLSGDDEQEIIRDFLKSEPVFASYDEFLNRVFNDRNI